MLTNLRGHMSYANFVATLALFVALGGSSYAALTITGRNVKDGTLTSADLRDNSIKSVDIADASLLARDFKAGQLRTGPPGPQGAPGAQGAKGEAGARGAKGDTGARGTSDLYTDYAQSGTFPPAAGMSLDLVAVT